MDMSSILDVALDYAHDDLASIPLRHGRVSLAFPIQSLPALNVVTTEAGHTPKQTKGFAANVTDSPRQCPCSQNKGALVIAGDSRRT